MKAYCDEHWYMAYITYYMYSQILQIYIEKQKNICYTCADFNFKSLGNNFSD